MADNGNGNVNAALGKAITSKRNSMLAQLMCEQDSEFSDWAEQVALIRGRRNLVVKAKLADEQEQGLTPKAPKRKASKASKGNGRRKAMDTPTVNVVSPS